jgi:protein phosphatase-4 regulatory subunit 3
MPELEIHFCSSDDPDFPAYKANYREFLRKTTKFHHPIPVRDALIQRKVHHTYRLQFLKDVVLARALDDSTFNVLNSFIIFNQIDIIAYVQHDPTFLKDIVRLFVDEDILTGTAAGKKLSPLPNGPGGQTPQGMVMDTPAASGGQLPNGLVNGQTPARSPSSSFSSPLMPPDQLSEEDMAHRREVVSLLQHLCAMGKNGQLATRLSLFRTLVDRGVLFAVQWALALPEGPDPASSRAMISNAGEILSAMLDHDLIGVRAHVLKQFVMFEKGGTGPGGTGACLGAGKQGGAKGETLLLLMCRMMAGSRDLAVQSQVGEALKALLDVASDDGTGAHVRLCLFLFVGVIHGSRRLRTASSSSRAVERTSQGRRGSWIISINTASRRCSGLSVMFQKSRVSSVRAISAHVPDDCSAHLVAVVTEPVFFLTRERTNLYLHLCELLCSFVLQHSFRSHFYVLTSNVATRVATLLRARDKHLRLGARPL